ncbi:hypothetical protein [Streptomyces celluloflavus]
MSRESDSSSSGLPGRGAAAYPSGTPPYGTPRGDADEAPAPGAAARPEEPKTETTLTTRIKINIPGSRPIPPVVVRKPVGEESGMNGSAGSGGSAGPAGTPRPARGTERKAERTASTPRPEAPADEAPAAGPAEKTSDWFAPRKPQTGPAGQSSTTGAHPAPTPLSATGPTPPRGPSGATPPHRPDLPYFSDSQGPPSGGSPFDGGAPKGFDGAAPLGGGSPFDGPTGPAPDLSPFDSPFGAPTGAGPSGPTAGPASGGTPPGLSLGLSGTAMGGAAPAGDDTALLTPQAPAPTGPGGGLGGIVGGAPGGANGTAPGGLKSGPKSGPKGGPKAGAAQGGSGGSRDRLSGDTLVSGIPAISADDGPPSPAPFPPAGTESPALAPLPKIPEPINPPKKGRNKIVLLGVGVVVLAGVAYGAGLLLDHGDVPNGTTALGVDIGGSTKDDAVKTLEGALKDRRTQPLKLTVDGKPQTLDPAKAGLDVDAQTTVRDAAGRDYNPVSVIGSLFGGTRTAKPAMIVDDEKLEIALRNVAGPAGAAKDGGITFENGKAVPHYGAPYKSLDVEASKSKVAEAYRQRVTGGTDAPVALAAVTQQPKVDKATVDRVLKQFAEPAMSGMVTVRTDAAHAVSFSPQKSIPKFLSFKVVNGDLVPYYDRPALQQLYGETFSGVLVARGDGSKKPVSVEDVAGAVGKALLGTTSAERIQTIATNGD